MFRRVTYYLVRHAEERANAQMHRARSRRIEDHGYQDFTDNYKGRPQSQKKAEERWGTEGRAEPKVMTPQEQEAIERWLQEWHDGKKGHCEGITDLDRALWPDDYPEGV